MKTLVPVKRVVDYNVKIRVRPDGSGVDLSNVRMSMNPFDEIAVEAALQLREAGSATEVIAVSVGPSFAQGVLRTALAMGADRAVLIEAEGRVEPLAVAKLVAALVAQEEPGLVVMGKQAIDDDCNQTGQMISALLGWSLASFASGIAIEGDEAHVSREVDGGLQRVAVSLPAVVTVDLRLNEPRYASLPNIMKSKKKPLAQTTPEALGVEVAPRLKLLRVEEPATRAAGVRLQNVEQLVARLRDEAQVI